MAFKSELKGPGSNCFFKHYNLYKNSRLKIKSSLAPFPPHFSIYRYQGEAYLLFLECIHNHAYEKSRFLRGDTTIVENKIPDITEDIKASTPLAYINPDHRTIHLLDKILSFDDYLASIHIPQTK